MILEYQGKRPRIGFDVFIAPTAVIIGDVVIDDGASIWFGAVVRGDDGHIEIGKRTNVQDNAVLHTTPEHPTVLGDEVTIGHGALLEGCTIGSGAVVGMGAIILENAVVASGSMIAAGSVVTPGTMVPEGKLAAGAPAAVKKDLSGETLRSLEISSPSYVRLAESYANQRLDDVNLILQAQGSSSDDT